MTASHEASLRWIAGERVRVDALQPGERFRAADGSNWVYDRPGPQHATHNVYRTNRNGTRRRGGTTLAGSLEVVRIEGDLT